MAVALAALPLAVSDRFVLKVLSFAGINALVAVGLALLFGYAGQVSMGHAAFVGLGAYTCAYSTAKLGWPWAAGFLLAGVVSALGGLLLALPSLRLKGHYLAMATLGFGELVVLAFAEAKAITGGVDGFTGIAFPVLGGFQFRDPSALYWLIWGVTGAAAVLAANLAWMAPGRAMRAVHDSEAGAVACGVDVTGIKVRAFVISAALAGLAGALYASLVGFVSPSVFALQASVGFVAMAVLGGRDSIAGPVAAAVALTLVQYLDALIPGLPRGASQVLQSVQPDLYGLAIVLVILLAPGGLASMWRHRGGERE